jgi:ribA/ribD-fused uncharacterized protein
MNLDDFLENPDQNPPILGFRGEYRFLSNFHDPAVNFNGVWFPTVEHAYQAAKVRDGLWHEVLDKSYLEVFAGLCSPGAAKAAGRNLHPDLIRPNWDDHKVNIMRTLVEHKFSPFRSDSQVAWLLEKTYPRPIFELNTWGDKFWGVVRDEHGRLDGENWLGKILMEQRENNRQQVYT